MCQEAGVREDGPALIPGGPHLPSAEPHHQVGDEGIFGLPGAMRHHDTPPIGLGQLAPRSQGTTRWHDSISRAQQPFLMLRHYPWQGTRGGASTAEQLLLALKSRGR